MLRRTITCIALLVCCSSQGRTAISVAANVSQTDDVYAYSYTFTNNGQKAVLVVDVECRAAVLSVSAPTGWQALRPVEMDGVQRVGWISTTATIPLAGSASGFVITALAPRGSVSFGAMCDDFSILSGTTEGPVATVGAQLASPGSAKLLRDTHTVQLGYSGKPMVVTADTINMQDRLYVESPDRSGGVAVQCEPGSTSSFPAGTQVWLTGTLGSLDGERCIKSAQLHEVGLDSLSVAPLFLTNRAMGGSAWLPDLLPWAGQYGVADGYGLNNVGLLVTTVGRVTEVDSASPPLWLRIDDGSGVRLKITLPTGVTAPRLNAWVRATGISSCEKIGDDLHRLLRVRDGNDIR